MPTPISPNRGKGKVGEVSLAVLSAPFGSNPVAKLTSNPAQTIMDRYFRPPSL